MRVQAEVLTSIASFLLARAGAEQDIALEVAANLVEADLCGHSSHGIRLVGQYVERLLVEEVSGTARPVLTSGDGPLVIVDGQRAFGQIVGAFAARHGVEAAKRQGVACVAVSGSGHFGRNGKWPEIAAAEGIASIHFINSPNTRASIAAPGSRDARLTSNPIAMGAPHPDGDHIILDFSVGEIAVNTIRLAAERGERLRTACVFGADGELTDDPAAFLTSPARAMLAFGGFKGYGLGVFTELFAGAIAGGACQAGPATGPAINNMLSFYIDPSALRPANEYSETVRRLAAWIRDAPSTPGGAVSIPGDRSRIFRATATREGIEVDASVASAIIHLGKRLNVVHELKKLWPEVS